MHQRITVQIDKPIKPGVVMTAESLSADQRDHLAAYLEQFAPGRVLASGDRVEVLP